MTSRTENDSSRLMTIAGSVFIVFAAALSGCEEKPPPSESARIMLTTRPETIDRSLVDEFSVRFGEVDPLAQKKVTVTNGQELHVTGTLKAKAGVLDEMEYLELHIGRRPIVDGRADWTLDESPESVTRLLMSEWDFGIRETIDDTVVVDTEPGEYELRFYAVRDIRDLRHGYLPEIYLLAEGRMTVLAGKEDVR